MPMLDALPSRSDLMENKVIALQGSRPMARSVVSLLLIALLALSACSSSASRPTFDASGSGLTADQITIRQAANDRTPPETRSSGVNWMQKNVIILLAGVGCVMGAAIGGSAGDCVTGAAIGGLTGAVASITVFAERDSYADDASYVRDVSDKIEKLQAENAQVADAADRLATQYAARIEELNRLYTAGTIDAAAYREEYLVMRADEEALRFLVQSNDDITRQIDKALTGVTVPTADQARLQEQEAGFLAEASRIEYALERLAQSLAQVPRPVASE